MMEAPKKTPGFWGIRRPANPGPETYPREIPSSHEARLREAEGVDHHTVHDGEDVVFPEGLDDKVRLHLLGGSMTALGDKRARMTGKTTPLFVLLEPPLGLTRHASRPSLPRQSGSS